MIGADRTSVSLAIGEFENRGTLTRGRGLVNLKSRQMLEKDSCQCYQVFKAFNSELGLRTLTLSWHPQAATLLTSAIGKMAITAVPPADRISNLPPS